MKKLLLVLLTACSVNAFSQGITTGCVTWINGPLPSGEVIGAAENLCSRQLIPRTVDVQLLTGFRIMNAAQSTVNALYRNNIPSSLPSDNFPTFIGDIDYLPTQYIQAIKAMCFLEYKSGRSCISRDYSNIFPSNIITTGNLLRMLYAAWNIPPDMQGYNVFNHNPSNFFSDVYYDDYNYGYFQRAFEDGILGSYVFNDSFPDNINVRAGEFYLVVLSNLVNRYGFPNITNDDYYNPNNIQYSNSSISTDITRGVFKTYERDAFHIPSGGIGLNFNFSYHSDWIDVPSLGVPNSYFKYGNYLDQLAKERNFPLGIGWTHSYNIFAQSVLDQNNNDKYLIIRLGDGTIEVYNVPSAKFESAGVYDKFIVTRTVDGHIASFNLVSKNQTVTSFAVSPNSIVGAPSFYLANQITNENIQSLTLIYDNSTCTSQVGNCFGSSTLRLTKVIDNFTQRYLTFQYALGTDLLSSVSDNTGRNIQFSINPATLNLDNTINARSYLTRYTYGQTDVDNHLLESITRPDGNTINNTYYARKLTQTQTPDYITSVSFTTSYLSSPVTTQGIVTTTPFSGTQYSITFNQNSAGTVSNISSTSSNIIFTYGDNQNPTLPTLVMDNQTGIREAFQYDQMGNVLESDYSSGGLTQTNHYTYDAANHVTSHTWPNNTVMTYQYDGNGNKTNETALNYKMDYGYFTDGQLAVQTDADQVVTNFAYNQYGNLNSISVSGTPIHYTADYDDVSRIKTITDGNLTQTSYQFDANDNLSSVVQDPVGLNIKTAYAYDQNDNLVSITPPQGADYTLGYNQSDNLASEQQQGLTREWGYNQDGTLNSFTDKNHNSFSYSYYPTNDPNQGKLKSNGIQSYIYNSDHLLNTVTTIQQDNGIIGYQYDQLLRPNYISFSSPAYSSGISYVYDISGNITQINLLNEGKSINYFYDGLNRLQTIKDWKNNTIVTYTYRNNGSLNSEVLGNGTTIFYHYDNGNRLDSVYSLKSDGQTLIHSIGCSIDNNGNHTRESVYVNWMGSPGTVYPQQTGAQFTYDQQYNWLLTGNGQHSSNDNNGNINNNAFSGFSAGTYDLHNNLLTCTVDGRNKKFLYDALENRYGDDSLLYTIDHINNGNVLVARNTTTPNALAIYIYSPYGLVCSVNPQTADDTFYLYDFRGSTLATIDKNQTVTDYYKYDSWGNVTESSSAPGKNTPFLFVGAYGVMYESPHLYYMRARYYDPIIGRFISEDSKWSTNLLSYAGDNPVKNVDPLGTSWFDSLINWVGTQLFGESVTTEAASPPVSLVGGLATYTQYTGVVSSSQQGIYNYNTVIVNNYANWNISANYGNVTSSFGPSSASIGYNSNGYSNSITASLSGLTFENSYTSGNGIWGYDVTINPLAFVTGAANHFIKNAYFEPLPEPMFVPAY